MPPNNILLKSLILLIHLKRGYRDTVEKHHTLHVGSYIYRTLLLIHLALVINKSTIQHDCPNHFTDLGSQHRIVTWKQEWKTVSTCMKQIGATSRIILSFENKSIMSEDDWK